MQLRDLIMGAFFAAAAIPAVGVMLWVEQAALEREKEAVHDKHLNMARQLAATVDLLADERVAVLKRYGALSNHGQETGGFIQTVASLGFRHLCVVSLPDGRVVTDLNLTASPSFNPEIARNLVARATAQPRFMPARRDASGRPTLFMVMQQAESVIVIAAIDPAFVAELAGVVSIGEKGHAVIVDQTGQALAHPLPKWREEMRNLSAVAPVAAMLEGEAGVREFFSPALGDGMIAGFATASRTGWGAMVVQPVAELQATAIGFLKAFAIIVAPLTLLFALTGGWLSARLIARPIERVADAARRFGAGDASARAPRPKRWPVSETAELGQRFNAMADAVRAHEDSLRASLDQALVADRAKTVFLANMSHELRTPLNAVIGFAELISAQMLGPLGNQKYAEYGDDIAKSGRHLLSLINDVLDISRVEADRVSIDIGDIDVAALSRLACRQVSPHANARGLDLSVDPPPDGTIIQADERRILQILLNLLTNAVRFTPRGGEVRLTAEPVGDCMRFTVADTGIGMSKAEAAIAIQPFGQPNQSLDPAERGAGLGLPLARSLALLHGGDLVIDSAPGAGCRVTVDIPMRSVLPAAAGEQAAA